jgi:hypothetical protein
LNVCGECQSISPDGDARDSEARRRECENEWEAHEEKDDGVLGRNGRKEGRRRVGKKRKREREKERKKMKKSVKVPHRFWSCG